MRPARSSEPMIVSHGCPAASSAGMPVISVQRGLVYTYRFSASVWKMPIGAASVSSRNWSADACTSRACVGERLRLDEEVREDRHLGPQLVGRDRGEDEVDRALGVAVGR